MKKTLLLLFLSLLIATSTTARDFTFTYEGQTLTYTVIDEEAKTCETKSSPNGTVHSISGSLTIPSSANGYTVTAIGENSFRQCRNMTELTIPTTVSSINDYAFSGCSGLTSVTLPVTTIGVYAFTSCSKLTSVTFTESLKSIDRDAFYSCPGLTSVYIPKSCTSIGYGAFGGCKMLLSIEVDPENENYASSDGVLFNKDFTTLVLCTTGKKGDYVIPESVTSIEKYAFFNCNDLTSISMPETLTTIGKRAFGYCYGLTSISIPESVINIDEEAFYDCGIKSIELPKTLYSIGREAFYRCGGLTSISIPESVKSIGYQAFCLCDKLTEVQCFMQEPCTADKTIFDSKIYENATLYVPAGTVSLYQATTPWNLFKNITDEPLLSGIEDVVADGVDAIDYTQPYEVYNLQGALVGQSTDGLAAGVYIVRQGEQSAKVAIR
ncbi:MAG: leucine-rich repeat protein [Bacteroides sp.]|nr:leucine-rich repeat protein [Bacteroides sp.]MBD5319882.1 leucine-rich repeat protein [Bacteroides sp.]